MQRVLKGAVYYADIAVEKGTRTASELFLKDYMSRKWTMYEHLLIMMLVQIYIDCKTGVITREECLEKQKEILNGKI